MINAVGEPTQCLIAAFGGHSNLINLTGSSFTLPTGDGYQYSFIMPYDAELKSIYFTSSNWATFTPPTGASVYPLVTVATAPPGSNSFTLLTASESISGTPWVGGTSNPAGTRVAICCNYRITGTTSAQTYYFYFSGGILLN